ncbi:hypothetical protein P43SY_008189 [Pythium insidiosum]|uniref:YTH domain-containing protein n=1 Tax=Pythium insidiosum TaxID=114742 RepID=A0AAD5Q7P2_PYTIN|nr:hypothetical protein P43SY_008189 [Pythium insidiosum]
MLTTSSHREEAHGALADSGNAEAASAARVAGTQSARDTGKKQTKGDTAKKNGGAAKSTKKRRPVKLAPRFSGGSDCAPQEMDACATESNDESVRLLRELFTTSTCRCFIVKSFSDANLHKSLKYGIWSSTYATNVMLDQVFQSDFSAVRPVLLFFSVCGTKHFSGIARMTSRVRNDVTFQLWEKPKYEGFFRVEWLLVKDVPNFVLTDIKMSNTPTKKSITSCRDGEEVLYEEASRFIDVFSAFPSRTSAWHDFDHFEQLQPALERKRGLDDASKKPHSHDDGDGDGDGEEEEEQRLARWLRRARPKTNATPFVALRAATGMMPAPSSPPSRPVTTLAMSAAEPTSAEYAAVVSPIVVPGAPPPPPPMSSGGSDDRDSRPSRALSSFFSRILDDDSSDAGSGEAVDDPELEAATEHIDVSTRFLCVSRDAVDKVLPLVVSISMGAYFGVGIRMLLTEMVLAFSKRQSELLRLLGAGFFLPNVVGCVVMGFVVRCKPLLRDRFSVYVTGVTTGFCGCCTTFASWDVGVAAKFVHGLWLTALLMIGVQTSAAIASYRAGYHAADGCISLLERRLCPFAKPPVDARQLQLDLQRHVDAFDAMRAHALADSVHRRFATTKESLTSALESCHLLLTEIARDEQAQGKRRFRTLLWCLTAVALVLWMWIPPFVGLDNYPSSRLFGLALGPLGAMLRYYLSLFNSRPYCKDFPLYTLVANVSASVLSCAIVIIGSKSLAHSSAAYRDYVFVGDGGLLVGFCGSLSTVSTWVSELDALSSRGLAAAYRYALASIVVAQLASVLMLGLFKAYSSTPLLV